MSRVLIVYFSQTGQLRRVAQACARPLMDAAGVQLEWLELRPLQPYPFPWPLLKFFDQFPEAVHLDPPAIDLSAMSAVRPGFDLVILAYTVWFLSPAPPITAFLRSNEGRVLLCGVPVVTLVACRNMWLMAQEQVKLMLKNAGAKHCDHIALTDNCGAMASFITTPRWMLTGRSDSIIGLPPAGIADADIAACDRFGTALLIALRGGRLDGSRPVLKGLKAASVDMRLLLPEILGRRSFLIWGALVRLCGRQGALTRIPLLLIYTVFLVTMICTAVPASLLIWTLIRPLIRPWLDARQRELEGPSGSDCTLLKESCK